MTQHCLHVNYILRQVADLMSRLGTSQAKVARDCDINRPDLGHWLNGSQTCAPTAVRAGAKAMQWYEANKLRQTAPQQPAQPVYKPTDAKRARPHQHPCIWF